MLKRLGLITVCFLLSFYFAVSQSDSSHIILNNKFNPSFNVYPGVIIKNYPGVPDEFFAGFLSINYTFKTRGSDIWHSYYHYPKIGIENIFGGFNNKSLGYTFGFIPNMEFTNTKAYSFKIGFGVTYFNKPFDVIQNPDNLYIGRHFTNLTIFSFGHHLSIGKSTELNYGISFLHSSDGHTALPNVGMNCVLFNVGFQKKPSNQKSNFVKTDSLKNKSVYSCRLGLGYHEFGETTKATGGPSYPSYHLTFYASRLYKNIHAADVGFTFSYYTSFRDYIVNQEVYDDKIIRKSSTGVVFLAHEFIFGKIGFNTQLGIYVYNPFVIEQKKIEGSWNNTAEKIEAFNTNRLGLVYYPLKKKNTLNKVNKQLMLGVYIKANLGQADLFEYSLGYRF